MSRARMYERFVQSMVQGLDPMTPSDGVRSPVSCRGLFGVRSNTLYRVHFYLMDWPWFLRGVGLSDDLVCFHLFIIFIIFILFFMMVSPTSRVSFLF